MLFTDRDDWPDERIVAAYRDQLHLEAAFRRAEEWRFLAFGPTFHSPDEGLRVRAV